MKCSKALDLVWASLAALASAAALALLLVRRVATRAMRRGAGRGGRGGGSRTAEAALDEKDSRKNARGWRKQVARRGITSAQQGDDE